MIARRLLLALSVIALSFNAVRPTFAADEDPPLPNVVVFLADDLGYGDLGCYGNAIIKTPNLDAFAKQGVRFTQCYSASSVCSPSRSAILTGRTPYRNGVFTWIPENSDIFLRKTEATAATLLRDAGYATCHVGKWHLNGKFNNPEQPQPSDHGYDHWFATQNNAAPSHKNPINFVRNGQPVGELKGYSADLVVGEALDWLKTKRDAKKPFFLTVWTHEPHLPIESDPDLIKLYPVAEKQDPDLAQHYANVTQMDRSFGALMKYLTDTKLADNTLVIFTSDNGPEGDGTKGRTRGSTGGLRGRKRNLYEGGIRVPGMVRWPGYTRPNVESNTPVIGSDIFATICDACRVTPPKARVIDGVSMRPAFDNKPVKRPIPMYWRYHDAGPNLDSMKIAMRQGDWKLLADLTLSKFELYNLADDRDETTDLAKSDKTKLAEMVKTLTALNEQIEKEGPDWWKGYGKK